MNEHDKRFNPESLDQQIEHPSAYLMHEDLRLIQELRREHEADASENRRSLERVWTQLEMSHHHKSDDQKADIHAIPLSYKQPERIHIMHDSIIGRPKQRSFMRIISTLAAVLVLAAIVGSFAFLMHARTQPTQTGSPGQVQTSSTKGSATTHAFDCSLDTDAGEHAVCLKGEETILNITKTIDGKQITITQAYADPNRLIIKTTEYRAPIASSAPTASSLKQADANSLSVTQVTVNGIVLDDGNLSNGHDGGGYYDSRTSQDEGLLSYDMSKIPAGTTHLQVQVSLAVLPSSGGVINFTIPFHSALRVVHVNQTLEVGNIPVTLDHVVVTESQTRLYFKNLEQTANVSQFNPNPYLYPLSVRNVLVPGSSFSGESSWTANGTKHSTFLGDILYFSDALFDRPGSWTLTIPANEVVGAHGTTPWVFTFTVPAA